MTPDELRKARKSKPFTQEQLGKAIGYSRMAVISWEKGLHPVPDIAVDKILAACVGVPVAKPTNARLTAETVKYYGDMRRDGLSHADIMAFWGENQFVPSPAAQTEILANFPDILNNGESK